MQRLRRSLLQFAPRLAATILAIAILSPAPNCNAAPGRVVLAAVGDISLARGVGDKIARFGPAYPLALVRKRLASSDIVYGNLECAVTRRAPTRPKPVTLVANPAALGALTYLPILVLGLANNHTFDAGPDGGLEALASLDRMRIRHVGVGPSAAAADQPVIVNVKGVKVAFVAFCQYPPPTNNVAYMSPATTADVTAVVAAARRRADVVVAGFHWGIEYQSEPTTYQRSLAKAAVDAGADLVVGSHPHVLQAIERVASKRGRHRALIAYSLGNFLFDSSDNAARSSEILEVTFDRKGVAGAKPIPVTIQDCRPRPLRIPTSTPESKRSTSQ